MLEKDSACSSLSRVGQYQQRLATQVDWNRDVPSGITTSQGPTRTNKRTLVSELIHKARKVTMVWGQREVTRKVNEPLYY